MKTESQPANVESAPLAPLSYDECVERLAYTVDHRDEAGLEEVESHRGRGIEHLVDTGRTPRPAEAPGQDGTGEHAHQDGETSEQQPEGTPRGSYEGTRDTRDGPFLGA